MAFDKTIQFMKYRKVSMVLSIVLVLIAIASLATQGLKLGLDFTGGTLVEVVYDKPADLNNIRNTLEKNAYEDALVINFGSENDVLVRLPQSNSSTLGDELLLALDVDLAYYSVVVNI